MTVSRAAGTGPVLARALRILGAFSADHPAMTLSELARRTRLPVSTVHRLLAGLVEWGALERGDDGYYRVGLRLWEVGALAPRGQGLRERATVTMWPNTGRFIGNSDSPMWKRGWRAFSRATTR